MHIRVFFSRAAGATVIGVAGLAVVLLASGSASAAIVAPVPLATSAEYAVLGGSRVTNTGPTVLDGSLGLWPGTAITGFPPGTVTPPGTTNTTNAAAQQAQSDLTTAYDNAAGRPLDATTTADLANLNLAPGVYAGPSKGALALNGPLTLDGGGNPLAVFIFQTNSTLITGSDSTVNLIGGAQECNVFWQVGSSATLGTGSVMVGNILALTSITVTTGVLVHGRALARNGAVTLDNDVFRRPTCATTTAAPTTTSTTAGGGTTTTAIGSGASTTTVASSPTTLPALTQVTATAAAEDTPAVVGVPRTGAALLPGGQAVWPWALLIAVVGTSVAASLRFVARRVIARR
jgi:hypothetical protein